MSARNRRLREAAAERDRQQSDDVGESASFVAEQIRDRRDDDRDRDTGGGGGGVSSRTRQSPEPDDEPSLSEQIGDLEPGEQLRASGGGGEGDPEVEVITSEEAEQRVREETAIARGVITRSELEASRRFQQQQAEFQLLGRIESSIEEQVGRDIELTPEDVRITQRDDVLRGELTERFVEEDLPGQLGLGAEADIDTGALLPPEGRPGDRGRGDTEQTAGERLRDIEAGLSAADRAIAQGGESFFGGAAEFAEGRPELEGVPLGAGTVVRRAGRGLTGLARIPVGVALTPFAVGRELSPEGIEARQQRAEEIGAVDVPTGGGFLPGEELDVRESESDLLTTLATFDEDLADPATEFVFEGEGGVPGAAVELGAGLVAGAAAFRAGAAVGPRAGTATRFALQPGEEILGRGGFAATRRLRGEETAERLFPGREPLIFSEEAALRGINRGIDRLQSELDSITVRAPGVGAGVPRLEVEFDQPRRVREPELADPADIEMQERLLEAEQRRVVPMQEQPLGTDLTPEGTIQPARGLDPRTRRRLEASRRAELEAEAEAEAEVLRTQLGLDLGVEQEPFEFETFETELDIEQELPPREIEGPPREIEVPPIETELPPRETEAPPRETEQPPEELEPIELPDLEDDLEDDLFALQQLQLEGVRTVEATLDPGELDLD